MILLATKTSFCEFVMVPENEPNKFVWNKLVEFKILFEPVVSVQLIERFCVRNYTLNGINKA